MSQFGMRPRLRRRHRRHLPAASSRGTGRRRRSGSAARPRSAASPRSAWKMALCSLSTGISRVPCAAQVRRTQLAGADHALLVGERQHPAVPRQLEPRRQPGRADDRRHRPVDRLRRRGAAAPPAPPPPRCRCRRAPPSARPASPASAVTATRARSRRACSASSRDVAAAGQRHHLVALGPALPLDERHGVLPDRAGRAEDADPPPHAAQDPITPIPSVSQIAKNHTPPITPSSRSMTPPCPGISRLASLTPNRRLTARSRAGRRAARRPRCRG